MKNMMMSIAATILLASAAPAQEPDRGYFPAADTYTRAGDQQVLLHYVQALSSDNPGVVESGLAHLAMMKLQLPGLDYGAAERKTGELARTAASIETRYKAFLVKTLLDEYQMFGQVAAARHTSADEFFSTLSGCMSAAIAGQ